MYHSAAHSAQLVATVAPGLQHGKQGACIIELAHLAQLDGQLVGLFPSVQQARGQVPAFLLEAHVCHIVVLQEGVAIQGDVHRRKALHMHV